MYPFSLMLDFFRAKQSVHETELFRHLSARCVERDRWWWCHGWFEELSCNFHDDTVYESFLENEQFMLRLSRHQIILWNYSGKRSRCFPLMKHFSPQKQATARRRKMNLISSTIFCFNPTAGTSAKGAVFKPVSLGVYLSRFDDTKKKLFSRKMFFRFFPLISIFNVSHYTTHYLPFVPWLQRGAPVAADVIKQLKLYNFQFATWI